MSLGFRGRVVALDVLVVSSSSPLPAQWMIIVKTTRFDDGHVTAWYLEFDGVGRCWPVRVRLDPSFYSNATSHTMQVLGIDRWCSMMLGPVPICLDDLESIFRRAPMPDYELGEDQCCWCLDILLKLEKVRAVVQGQALLLESNTSILHAQGVAIWGERNQ